MNKKTLIFAGILAVILIIGIFWYAKDREWRRVINNQELEENKIESKGEQKKETLNDLVNNIEEIKLPEIDTSNWQPYQNEKYGFGFKIPKDWYAEDTNDGSLCLKSKTKVFHFEGEKGVCGISLDMEYFHKYFKNESEFVELIKNLQNQGIITKIGYFAVNNRGLYFNWSNAEVIIVIYDDNNLVHIIIQGADSSIQSVFYGITQTLHFIN
jgi:hypothetical protein